MALPKACSELCCPRYAVKNGRCEEHAKERGKQVYQDRRNSDPDHERYQRPEWKKLSKNFKNQNPICLAIEANGQQCRYKSDVVHHRIAAKERPDLFLEPKNLAALCSAHHGHTPGDAPGARYAPAQYFVSYVTGNLAEPSYSISAPPPPRAGGAKA
jgi:5-methylcytosine-specific restriction endonuclease McrA